MSSLVLDLETVLDPCMPPYLPRSGDSDSFPPPPYWMIVCIGLLLTDDALRTRKIGVLEGSESEMLSKLVRCVEGPDRRPDLVTFNGRRFDLPVITARLMRHGIAMPSRFARDVNYRFTDAAHFDVSDVLTDYGAGRQASLDAWSKCIGMPGKLDVQGSDVATMVAEGYISKVQEYCMGDVVQTHALRLRFDMVRGRCDRGEYIDAMRSLIDTVEAHPRLTALSDTMDRKRLLLEDT